MQLDHLSLNELQVLSARAAQEIEKRRSQVRKEGLEKIKSIVAEYGFTPDEIKSLIGSRLTANRGKVAPKYRDPNNSENMWTGRGRKPKWVGEFLAAGGDLQAIVI
jgi:DNA-binding protein H-NS